MRILGIDPGLDITGYGVIEQRGQSLVVIEAGIIKTSHSNTLERRLKTIYSQLLGLINAARPGLCVIEKLYSHYKHPMTSILMGHARGAVLLCCSNEGLGVIEYPAKTVKRSVTGNGNASKIQVQQVINRLLNLEDTEKPLDLTDALALCLTYIHHAKKSPELARV